MAPGLIIGVKRSTWRMHDPAREAADAEYARRRRGIMDRDAYTCRFCGFAAAPMKDAPPDTLPASGYLQIHHRDDDHRNNRAANLITACPLCHQVFHCGNAGHQSRGWIIWCPWLDQADLNITLIHAWMAIHRGGAYAESALALVAWLSSFDALAAARFGPAVVDAADLGSALMGLKRSLYERRETATGGLRLLADMDAFGEETAYWSETSVMPEKHWDLPHA